MAGTAAWAASIAPRTAYRPKPNMSKPIVSAWGSKPFPNWTFLVAFSFFRSIAIYQGVYKRSLDGNASNPELARQVGESVPFVAHIAWEGVEAAA